MPADYPFHPSTASPSPTQPTTTQRLIRGALAALLALLAAWMLRHYLSALVWAGILAIAVWPVFERARRRWPPGRRNIRLPALFTLAIGLLFIVPLVLVALRAAVELHQVFDWMQHARNQGLPVPDWVRHLPLGGSQAAQWWQDHLSNPDAARQTLKPANRAQLLDYSRHFGEQVLHRAILFGFTLLTLFFLFRDGRVLTEQLRTASHNVLGPHGERIGQQIIASVHGTVDGLVLVGLGEGVLLGLAYVAAGVPQAVLLGAVTALAATIPFGAVAAYLLAAAVLLASGATVAAICIAAFGSVVVFVADHFVRPTLIGGATRLPFLFVLLGILGGLETLGLLGLFVGPALMAVLILLWREWTARPPQAAL